jgi:hypothetical protein
MITSNQYSVSNQTLRNLHIKINLLNFSYQVIDSLEGNAIAGSINIDANSDIRRTCSIELVVTDSSFNVQSGGKIFLDRYIQIYVGVDDIHSGDTVWFNEGIYLINQPSYKYTAETNTLSFDGVDLMGKLMGLRNGYLIGTTYEIAQGSNIRDAIIAALALGGFTKYIVEQNETTLTVPITLSYNQGSTIYDMLAGLRDIEPFHQIYFDVDGVFHYDLIPSGQNENVSVDDSTWVNNVISEEIQVDFESVKNSIEVYGLSHDVKNYPTNTVYTGDTIQFTIPSVTALSENLIIGFTLVSDVHMSSGIKIQVNSLSAAYLVSRNGLISLTYTQLSGGVYYAAMYQSNGTWLLLGHQQAYAQYKDVNPNSPFYIGSDIGEIKYVCYGGEYENIQTDSLALQRAKYELYVRCRLNDTITLTSVPIYYLDVHQLVNYTPKANNSSNTTYQYITQSISYDLSVDSTMSITMSKFYPAYPIL